MKDQDWKTRVNSPEEIFPDDFVYVKKKEMKPHWKREHLKYLRNTGQAYVTKGAKIQTARRVQPACTSCKMRCTEKFTDKQRETIFRHFWSLGNVEKQRIFIAQNLEPIKPKYRYSHSNRTFNFAYHFDNEKGQKLRVCKIFFSRTLDISSTMLAFVTTKMQQSEFTFKDDRGKHKRKSKVEHKSRLA